MSQIAADVILVVHFAFVLFVVGGLVAIWSGAVLHWAWVRAFWFRVTHIAAISFVAAESLMGVMCPLTVWEDALRGRSSDSGFIARWVHAVMFYNLPEWIFTMIYLAFAGIVIVTYWLVPPRRKARTSSAF
jgi:hypothetical protein